MVSKPTPESVDDYLDLQADAVRPLLERVRAAIRKALPDADESISYKIPAYKLRGRAILYFAAWKNHYSVYPVTAVLVAELGNELAGYEMNKGTIRFPFNKPVPVRLIQRIARIRAKEEAAAKKR